LIRIFVMSKEYGCGYFGVFFLIYLALVLPIAIWMLKILLVILVYCLGILAILIIPTLIIYIILKTIQAFRNNGFEDKRTIIIPSLTLFTGGSIGFLALGGTNILAIIALVSSSISLFGLLVYFPLNRRRLIKKYQENEQNLISS